MKLEINNRRKTGESTNVWKLNNQNTKEEVTWRLENN